MIVTGAVSIASLTLMCACFLLVAALVYFCTTFDVQSLALFILGGGLFLLLLAGAWVVTERKAQHELAEEEAIQVKMIAQAEAQHVAKKLSNEELWDQLTRPKIPLDGDVIAEVKQIDSESSEPAPVRPSWVDKPPTRVGNVYRVAVSSDRYRDVEECHQALEPRLFEVVNQRIAQLSPNVDSPSVEELGFGLDFVLREICHNDWVETVEASFGEMKIVHVLMEFNAAMDDQLRDAVRDFQRHARITNVGSVAGLSLGGLALLFGLLKMDTWTRGYYTKRLFLGVPAAIIGLLLLII